MDTPPIAAPAARRGPGRIPGRILTPHARVLAGLGAGLLAAGAAAGGGAGDEIPLVQERHTRIMVPGVEGPVSAFQRDGRILSLYGRPMSGGGDARASAKAFIARAAPLYHLAPADLHEGIEYSDGTFAKGLMFDPATGRYRLTLLRYSQYVGAAPVFRSELKLLVRNEPGFPLVLANSSLRDLRGFAMPAAARAEPARALALARAKLGGAARILEGPKRVVWAGVDTDVEPPRPGMSFVAERGDLRDLSTYAKWLFIVDLVTGGVLYAEDQVLGVDVEGTVAGFATEGTKSDSCSTQSSVPLPFARVNIGSTETFTDENGAFLIPNSGGDPVTVESRLEGRWFDVDNLAGPDALLAQTAIPPGPVDFVHNPDGGQFTTAEVNGYLNAQKVRDYALGLDPDFPIFQSSDMPFGVLVNDASTCNAFYQGTNVLFLREGGGCPNTSYTAVIYHEYGHHLVARSTGSQCEWGEGNADITAVAVTDEPELAFGFLGDCAEPLRNADNTCQYSPGSCSSCGGPCHSCGMLISGCVWDLRNELLATNPDDYRLLLGRLWLASLFLHDTGTSITPADTVNYLIADDNDGNLDNGTPHYHEIARAFGRHNMDAPPVFVLSFRFPDGVPRRVAPDGSTTIRVIVEPVNGVPEPGTGTMIFDDGRGPVEIPMTEDEPNRYHVSFPSVACGTAVQFYFTARSEGGFVQFAPDGAPEESFTAVSANAVNVALDDDFEEDTGWTIENENLLDGAWERGVPVNDGRGDPPADFDGSGSCYVTGNAIGNSDVDGGPTRLISPVLDLSAFADPLIEYARWFTNDDRDEDRLDVEVSGDGGTTWTLVERVAHQDEWSLESFRLADFLPPGPQVQVRFSVADDPNNSVTEAGIDAVKVFEIVCMESCPEDLDGSGAVDFGDILAVLAAWGNTGGREDLDGSGVVDFGDLLAVLAAWGPCR